MMHKLFEDHLEKHAFPTGKKVLLAVSGGMDSMVMCALFLQAKHPIVMAHCNFKLRGKESDGDEKFLRAFAKKNRLRIFTKSFPTEKLSKQMGTGIQETARHLRYEWLEEIRKQEGFDRICTAHHLDDSIETFLFHLSRGTGVSGLHGISVQKGSIFRPLLFAYREEIKKFAADNKINFRDDSSNTDLKYTRNRIRHKVIPEFLKVNPAFKKNMVNTMQYLAAAEMVYKDAVWSLFNEIAELRNESVRINKSKLTEAENWQILLYEYLHAFSFNAAQVRLIVSSIHLHPGKIFHSRTHTLLNDRSHFIISPARNSVSQQDVLIWEEFTEINSPLPLRFSEKKFKGTRTAQMASLDRQTLNFPLSLRKWKQGDYFYPVGMTGRKKLSDFLIDLKVPRTEKEGIFVLTSGENIVWVVGMRVDRRFASTEQSIDHYCVEMI